MILYVPGISMNPGIKHKIIEYSEGEGTHKNDKVQLLTPHRTTPKIRNQRRIYVEIHDFAFASCSVTK